MPLILADRVRDTTTTTGTGTVTLSGTAPTGYQNFSVIGNGNTTYYTINAGSQWEVGIGTYSSTGPTLARNTVLESSNANALVDFAAGTKDVFVTYPSDEAVYQDGATIAAGTAVLGVTNGGTGVTTSTGTGSVVLSNSPTLVTPTLGAASATSIANGLGAVGTPSYTFTGDLNTGMWSPAADTIAFSEGGVEAMRLDSAGNVGIGTSSPAGRLHVVGSTNTLRLQNTNDTAFPSIEFGDSAAVRGQIWVGGASYASFGGAGSINYSANSGPHVWYTNYAETMRITAAGNVGIGTTAPSEKFVVANSTAAFTVMQATNSAGYGKFGVRDSGDAYVEAPSGKAISFWNTAERMRIDSSGNVGIGTSSPGVRLDVSGSVRVSNTNSMQFRNAAGTGTAVFTLQSDDNFVVYNATGTPISSFTQGSTNIAVYGSNTNNRMQVDSINNVTSWTVNGSERARINSSGQFLVGTTSGGRTVCINAADNWIRQSNPTRSWLIGPSNGANYLIYDETGGATRLTIETNGVVTASGDFRAPIFYDSNNTAYYGDFASTSILRGLTLTDGSPAMTFSSTTSGRSAAFGMTDAFNMYLSAPAGGVLSLSTFRAPLFQDSDNTAFFLDPASTSVTNIVRANTLQFSNGNTAINLSDGSYSVLCDPSGRAAIYLGNGDPANYYDNTAHNFRTRGGSLYAYINANGVHAPVYYDFNNTGYYLDPTSTTSLRTVGSWRSDSAAWDGEFAGKIQYHASNWYLQYAGAIIGRNNSGTDVFTVNTAGSVVAAGDMRAPIFYDSNNTAYYMDPFGTTQLLGNLYVARNGASNDAFGGLEVREASYGGAGSGAATEAPGINFHWAARAAARLYMDAGGNFVLGGQSDITNNRRSLSLNALNATGNVTAFSDIRVKDNIEQIEGALDRISRIRGVTYTRTDLEDKERRYGGVIAQEIEQVLPEAIFERDDRKAVDYNATIGLLIEAVKELTARVAELEGK